MVALLLLPERRLLVYLAVVMRPIDIAKDAESQAEGFFFFRIYTFISVSRLKLTGEIFMMHIAHRAVIV